MALFEDVTEIFFVSIFNHFNFVFSEKSLGNVSCQDMIQVKANASRFLNKSGPGG